MFEHTTAIRIIYNMIPIPYIITVCTSCSLKKIEELYLIYIYRHARVYIRSLNEFYNAIQSRGKGLRDVINNTAVDSCCQLTVHTVH